MKPTVINKMGLNWYCKCGKQTQHALSDGKNEYCAKCWVIEYGTGLLSSKKVVEIKLNKEEKNARHKVIRRIS